jgi:hypothetical protein
METCEVLRQEMNGNNIFLIANRLFSFFGGEARKILEEPKKISRTDANHKTHYGHEVILRIQDATIPPTLPLKIGVQIQSLSARSL